MDADPDLETPAPARPRRPWIWLGVALAVVGGLATLGPVHEGVRVLLGGEPRFVPEHPINLDGVDLEAVHGALWTDWVVAQSRPDIERRRAARDALRAAIAADANLTALFDELTAILDGGELADERVRERALWLTRAWNQYLDGGDQPYFLNAHVMLSPGPVFYALAYRVIADTQGTVDGEPSRVRVVRRLDTLNLRERYTGYVSSVAEGALVIGDRTVQFALDRIWPTFGVEPGAGSRPAAFAKALAAEARAGLSSEAIAVLAGSADARRRALAVHEAIVARRACGSRFIVPDLPWDGHDPRALDKMARYVEEGSCPSITAEEVATLRDATTSLRSHGGLLGAIDELAWWCVRGIAVHELRHVADDVDLDDEDDLPCERCPAGTSTAVRAEASAYLAELAWSEAPALSLLDACTVADEADGLHARAATIILQAGGWTCDDAPPEDLPSQARALEREMFGRSEAIVVGDGLHAPVPLVVDG